MADWSSSGYTYETALALIVSLVSLGGLVGGLFISTWGGLKKKRIYGVLVPMIISGLAQTVYGGSSRIYLSAGMALVFSAMIPILNAHSQTIWQTQTPRGLQGRVFSVRRLIAQCTVPLSTLLAGLCGGLFNPGQVMVVLGLIMTLFCIGQLVNPYLLRVEDRAWLDEQAAKRVAG